VCILQLCILLGGRYLRLKEINGLIPGEIVFGGKIPERLRPTGSTGPHPLMCGKGITGPGSDES